MNPFPLRLARRRVGLLLVAAYVLFLASLFQLGLVVVDVDDLLGLTSHLPVVYWVGLGLLVWATWYGIQSDTMTKGLVIGVLIAFALYFFGISVFSENNPRFYDAFWPSGESRYLIKEGWIPIKDGLPLIYYHAWPGFHAFFIILSNVTLAGPLWILRYWPLWWSIVAGTLVLYGSSALRIPIHLGLAGVVLFLSGFWMPNYYLQPRTYAYLLYLLVVGILLTTPTYGAPRRNASFLLACLGAALVVTHGALPFIAVLLPLVVLSIFRAPIVRIAALFAGTWLAWNSQVALGGLGIGIRSLLDQIANIDFFFLKPNPILSPQGELKKLVDLFRLGYLGLFLGLSIGAVLSWIRARVQARIAESKFAWILLWIATMTGFGFWQYGGGHEMWAVVYILILPLLTWLAILGIRNRPVLLTSVLLAVAIHIPAHYGAESVDMTRDTVLAGSEFFAHRASKQHSLFLHYGQYIGYFDREWELLPRYYLQFLGGGAPLADDAGLKAAHYIIHDQQLRNNLIYAFGKDPLQEWLVGHQTSLSHIYTNAGYDVYAKIGTE